MEPTRELPPPIIDAPFFFITDRSKDGWCTLPEQLERDKRVERAPETGRDINICPICHVHRDVHP